MLHLNSAFHNSQGIERFAAEQMLQGLAVEVCGAGIWTNVVLIAKPNALTAEPQLPI